MRQNPYRQALLSIGIFGLIAALVIFILAVIPYNPSPDITDPYFWIRDLLPRAPWLLLAGFIGAFSGASLLAWIYGSAKRWNAPVE